MGFNNNMFSSFTNLDTTYTPNPFLPSFPPVTQNNAKVAQPNLPYEIKTPDDRVTGYFWYYGNSVELVFTLKGTITFEEGSYIEIKDVISSMTFQAVVYDFRHIPVLKFSSNEFESENVLEVIAANEVENNKIVMSLTNELSSKLVKGKYCIELTAYNASGFHTTLFSSEQNKLTFEVR